MTTTILIGALTLFIYSIDTLSYNLESLSSQRIKRKIAKATSSTSKSLFVGFFSTSLVQSSSAVSMIVVGLINARLLRFESSIGLILGSNIASTMTSFIVGINFERISSFIMIFGVILMFFKGRKHLIGKIIFSVGMLFFSIHLMTLSINELKDSVVFYNFVSSVSTSFILSLIVGCLLTITLQSSGVFIAILQVLALSGFLGLKEAIPFIFGANIGTTIDSFIALINSQKDSKKLIHFQFYFNLITVIIFSILFNPFYLFISYLIKLFNVSIRIQISLANVIFNIFGVLITLPFLKYIKHYYAKW